MTFQIRSFLGRRCKKIDDIDLEKCLDLFVGLNDSIFEEKI